jgi:tyrosine-protein kinase Etk/Wzc
MERQGIVSLDDESKKVIDQLGQLEATRDATEISLRQKRNTLASYQAELPQQETNVARVMGEASDPYIRLLQEQLAKLEVQRDVTIAQNPAVMGRELVNERVKEVDNQIASLRQRLQKRTDEFLRTLTPAQGGGPGDAASYLQSVKQKIIETQIEVDALESKKKALQEVIRTYEGQFERIPRKSVELARLQRSRLTNEKLYLMIEEKYNEANITEKSNIGYVEIIEPAAIPRRPSSPKLPLNLAIGLVLGFALGVGIVLTREIMHERVFSPEDVRRHGLVPLTTVVEADEESAGPRGGDGGTDAGRLGRLPLVTLHAPFSPIAESYRQLRTNIQFGKTGSAVSTILVTSPTPGEGKSTTASNLAVAFAQAGKKVLLVDGDLRMPTLDSAFTINRKPGLADMLKGEAHLDTAMHKTSVENLKVVPSGTLPPNPAELLSSEAMKDFLTVARRQFEIVVFDSSPVLAVTDPAVISTLVDATVLVVSAGKTAAKELESAVEVLRSIGTDPAGVVLNGFDPRQAYGFSYGRSKRHYYYGYGTPKGSMGVSAKKVVIEQKEQGG